MAARFPEDVIYVILSRLPAKSLGRFKCVCKAWYELIQSSDLINFHLNRSLETQSNFSLIFTSNSNNTFYHVHGLHSQSPSTKLSFPKSVRCNSQLEIIGSCNGLICVKLGTKDLALCNPTTQLFQLVPRTKTPNSIDGIYGFGYDRISDDYKIVKFLKTCIMVYSMRSNSWSPEKLPVVPDGSNYFDKKDGMFLNNLHWVWGKRLYTFDIHDQTWGRVLAIPENDNDFKFGVFDGCLCLTYLSPYNPFAPIDQSGDSGVWVMKEYGVEKSWTKLFSFEGEWGIPLAYSEKPNEVVFCKIYVPGFFRYNLRDKTIDDIEVPILDDFPFGGDDSYYKIKLCAGSLVPLMGNHKLQAKGITMEENENEET